MMYNVRIYMLKSLICTKSEHTILGTLKRKNIIGAPTTAVDKLDEYTF